MTEFINGIADLKRHPEFISGFKLQEMKGGYVYIMSNKSQTTFYIGVSIHLEKHDSNSITVVRELNNFDFSHRRERI
jgi:hypothetical protein